MRTTTTVAQHVDGNDLAVFGEGRKQLYVGRYFRLLSDKANGGEHERAM
jgi:hypothetical protein